MKKASDCLEAFFMQANVVQVVNGPSDVMVERAIP
jgi:hypothetical protein